MIPSNIRVLLIDDDEDDYVLVRDMCEEIRDVQIELTWVCDYDKGLARLLGGHFDAHLIDYRLGARTGVELIHEARKIRGIGPLIVLTGATERNVERNSVALGADDFLEKSTLTARQLERAIRYALGRSQTLQALRSSEQRYALATQGSRDGIWDWDLVGDEMFVSGRWKSIVGLSPEEVLNRPTSWFNRVHPRDRKQLQDEITAHLEGVTPVLESEHRIQHSDGTWRWVLARGLVIGAEGKPQRMAGSLTDIHERKNGEETLLSHVSHELRTPLNALYQYLSLFQDEILGPLTDRQREVIVRSLRNVDQLKVMIEDIMDSSRMRAGKFVVEPRFMNLRDSLSDAVSSVLSTALERQVEVRELEVPAAVAIYGDPGRVRQVIVNLLDNALKFTQPGGRVQIGVVADPGSDDVVVQVTDTGCGVDSESIAAIFERLHQEDGARDSGRKGLGLGLHICREIVRRHGGRIWVQSVKGKGSTFSFSLPAFRAQLLLRSEFHRLPPGRQQLGVLTLEAVFKTGEGDTAALKETFESIRAELKGTIIPELDCLLPALSSEAETRFHIVSFTDEGPARFMAARLIARLEHCPEARNLGVTFEGRYQLLSRVESNETLDGVLARAGQLLEEMFFDQSLRESTGVPT